MDDHATSAEAIQQINGDTNACAIAFVVYHRGAEVLQVRNSEGTFTVVEIIIVAADLGRGFQPVRPFNSTRRF